MDRATESLNKILASGEYECVPGIACFDVHDEFDAAGNLVRRFNRADLEEICRRNNKRTETGDLSPFGPGHTIPGRNVPETSQPVPWGFAANWRVDTFGPAQKVGLLADFYVKKVVQDGDKLVPGRQAMATYPRRSVELWPADKFIDWIALMRRTPERDLGLLTYGKATETRPASLYAAPALQRPLAASYAAGKLRYSMEMADMPLNDPTMPPDANADDFHGKCDQYMREKYPHLGRLHAEHALRYEKEDAERDAANAAAAAAPPPVDTGTAAAPVQNDAAAPSAANTFPPKDDALRMAKDSEAIRYARIEQENAALRRDRDEAILRYARAESERCVTQAESEGFLVDRVRDVESLIPMNDTQRASWMDDVRHYRRKDTIGKSPPPPLNFTPPGLPPRQDGVKRYSREQVNQAMELVERDGIRYEDALEKVAAQ